MADMIVAGAGTYVENGTVNGKPKYTYGDPARWIFRIRVYRNNKGV